jgi:hypothetical protein
MAGFLCKPEVEANRDFIDSYSYSNGAIMTEPIFDHEKLDVYWLSIEYVAASYGTAKRLKGANRHIRDQWLRAAQSTATQKRQPKTHSSTGSGKSG